MAEKNTTVNATTSPLAEHEHDMSTKDIRSKLNTQNSKLHLNNNAYSKQSNQNPDVPVEPSTALAIRLNQHVKFTMTI